MFQIKWGGECLRKILSESGYGTYSFCYEFKYLLCCTHLNLFVYTSCGFDELCLCLIMNLFGIYLSIMNYILLDLVYFPYTFVSLVCV